MVVSGYSSYNRSRISSAYTSWLSSGVPVPVGTIRSVSVIRVPVAATAAVGTEPKRFMIHDHDRPSVSTLELPGRRESWLTVVATLSGYGPILAAMFLALFVLPYVMSAVQSFDGRRHAKNEVERHGSKWSESRLMSVTRTRGRLRSRPRLPIEPSPRRQRSPA